MTLTPPAAHADVPPGHSRRKADHLARLARIEGQVGGVARIASGDCHCTDVLTQISSSIRAP
jgi:CsoR family transcriptional regulator, copper-sensing transcriptional repressor